MTQPTINARMATTAIAAALAMSATPLFAQEAPAPATTTTTTTTTTTPAPATTTAPASTTDPLAPDPAATETVATPTAKTSTKTTTTHRTTRVATAKPAPAPVHVASKTVTTHTVAAKPADAAVAGAPAVAPPAAPIVDVTAKPAAPAPVAAKPASQPMTTELMFGIGALVLIALAAAAIAMRRRRRAKAEWIEEEHMEPAGEPEGMGASDPIFADRAAAAAPEASAFAWGDAPQTAESAADDSDRLPGETWVERAYRGPSANNPSESLKTRLSRAAFFDKREREVAAGVAEPVDAAEGLPEAMIEEQEGEPA